MPPAWIAFLSAAETYFQMYGDVEAALDVQYRGSTAVERTEIGRFLDMATSGDEAHCRKVTKLADPILAANTFHPVPCLPFYQAARKVFDPDLR